MKDIYIKKFGQKLFSASKSVNNIPMEYLKQSFNARIYDGGIGPRKGKVLITQSNEGTKNQGGFVLDGVLYQITNSKIYSIDLITGIQTEKATLGYDKRTDVLVYGDKFAIIVCESEPLKVFGGNNNIAGQGVNIYQPTNVPSNTGGIIEFINSYDGYTLYAVDNILYISRPIIFGYPEYAYDFINTDSQKITYKSKIVSIKVGMTGVFIFMEDGRVEFIGSGSLQNIGGVPTFASTFIGIGGVPMNNRVVTASGDQVFYLTKNKIWNTINYIPGADRSTIGKLSSKRVVGIDEMLKGIDISQPNAESFYNQNDNTIQTHIRTTNSIFNNIVLVYDLINNTFNIDTGKNYNYVIKLQEDYYGFSDINSNIYRDNVSLSDNGSAIPFKIRTQALNFGSIRQKLFGGLLTAGAIGNSTELTYQVFIDGSSVFKDIVKGISTINGIGEIAGNSIGEQAIGGDLTYKSELEPFERIGDQGRIYLHGTRLEIEITSISQVQDFIIDMLGTNMIYTNHTETTSKF